MAHYKADIQSARTVDATFAYLSRFDFAAQWDPGVSEGSMLTEEPVGVGSRFRLVARFLGRSIPLVYEIIEFESPYRVVLRAESATIRSTDTIGSRAADPNAHGSGTGGAGTRVEYDAVLEAKGLCRIVDPLLTIAFRRIGDRATAGLGAVLAEVPA